MVVLERSHQVGGVWRQHANPFSRVNSSEPSYRVPVRRPAPNTNHSHHSEMLLDALRLLRGEVEPDAQPGTSSAAEAARAGASPSLAGVIFLGCEVRSVREAPAAQPPLPQQPTPPAAGWSVCGVCSAEGAPFEVRSGTVVVCTNRRLGVPRSLTLQGEADFLGAVRRGLAGDSEGVRWKGQRVVILGMGAFAIENMRTAFERGAAHVTLLCRRRGTVCPQLVDWINFIRPWEVRARPPRHTRAALKADGHSPTIRTHAAQVRDHQPRHATAGDADVLQAWRAAYDVSGAVRPECWQQGMLKPDGHTVSVSDLFFIAHHQGMMSVELGEAACLEPTGVRTKAGKLLEAGVVVKAPHATLNVLGCSPAHPRCNPAHPRCNRAHPRPQPRVP